MTKHIFTIDDERSIRDAFVLALEDFADVEVHEAENGLLGVELAKEIVPDLVFTDLNMPVMNGVDAIKLIRDLHPDVDAPVSRTDYEAAVECFEYQRCFD